MRPSYQIVNIHETDPSEGHDIWITTVRIDHPGWNKRLDNLAAARDEQGLYEASEVIGYRVCQCSGAYCYTDLKKGKHSNHWYARVVEA